MLAPPAAPDEIGRLGPFRVLGVIGRGGMGVVFRAEDPHLDRLVALKAMLPALGDSTESRRRFLREARMAAAVSDENVVRIHQVGEVNEIPFLTMEFLEGESLDARLQHGPRLSLAEILRIGRETALGLAAAHKCGLVHRDIKPGQPVAGGGRGRVKILDFGLARPPARQDQPYADRGHHGHAGLHGAGAGARPRHRSALRPFQPGLRAVPAVHRRAAVQGPRHHRHARLRGLRHAQAAAEINPAVPAELSDLVMELLAKKPEDRPAVGPGGGGAVGRAGDRLDDGRRNRARPQVRRSAARPGHVPSPSARRRGRRLALGAVVLLALVLVGVGLVFGLRSRTGTVVVNLTEPDVEMLIDGRGSGPWLTRRWCGWNCHRGNTS